MMKTFYFGGQFNFMYKDFSIENLKNDYRSKILGDYNLWINKPDSSAINISNNIQYVGPFYFTGNKDSESIVKFESSCIEKASDCVFVLSNKSAPGTITEIIQSVFLKKNIHIFYEKNNVPEDEVSTKIKNDLWYALIFVQQNSSNVEIFGFETYDLAVNSCVNWFKSIKL